MDLYRRELSVTQYGYPVGVYLEAMSSDEADERAQVIQSELDRAKQTGELVNAAKGVVASANAEAAVRSSESEQECPEC